VWTDAGHVAFDPSVQWNRPALLLAGGSLFVAFGSGPNGNDHEESFAYHGWMFRYDAGSLDAPPAVWSSTPRSSGGSIWQSGAGPAADGDHVYFATANVVLGCSIHSPAGFPLSPADAEDSVVRVPISYESTDLRLPDATTSPIAETAHGTIASYGDARLYSDTRLYAAQGHEGTVFQFTSSGDNGFGSSGPTLIAGSRDLVVSSKGGIVYLLDRDTMEPRQAPLAPFDLLPLQGGYLSGSADGDRPETSILWATAPGALGGGRAMAFDALTLALLWSTDTPSFSKFTPPTVARGRLLVPSAKHGSPTAVLVYAPR
jgi:outer membrane protein assembly factor BamB